VSGGPGAEQGLGDDVVAGLNRLGQGHLPGWIGLEVLDATPGMVVGRLAVLPQHLAPNGFLHAAAVVALADTCCGYGCRLSLPEGAAGFTTIELKSNFLRTRREGNISCVARLVHGRRSTQVWDAEITDTETGQTLALFRCTQAVLWSRA
jgi:uncharacterized protein (TIGR00369 family)